MARFDRNCGPAYTNVAALNIWATYGARLDSMLFVLSAEVINAM